MKRFLSYLTAALFVLVMSNPSFAYRPLSTEDAGVGALGDAALELGYDQVNGKDEREHGAAFCFALGLGRGEVGGEGGFIKTPYGEKGFCDLLFYGKLLLLGADESTGMLSVKGEALSTTGNEEKGLGGENWEYAGSLVFSKSCSKFTFHVEGGYNYLKDSEDNSDNDSLFYGLALDYTLKENIKIAGEVTGSHCKEEKETVLLGGVIFELNDMIALDAGIGRGFTTADNEEGEEETDRSWLITAGATFSF